MKKLLIIMGSPRQDGICRELINQVSKYFLDCEIKVYDSYKLSPAPCTDCKWCEYHEGCSNKDLDVFFEDFDMEKYAKLIADMDLRMEDKASKLSSGMAAKLKIAATLARAAKLYLLDEPLNGIDIIAREKIITTIINAVDDESTVVISSHLVDELEAVVDSVIFIKEGRNILQGEAEQLREQHSKSIVELYKEIYA